MNFTYSLSEIEKVAQEVIPFLTSKIIVFEGGMGMGKTTFIKSLVKALGVDDVVTSPTFSLVNTYENKEKTIFHFDFYRIKEEEEAFDIGFKEYLYSGNWCFIEWAKRVSTYLPDEYIILDFQQIDEVTRKISVRKNTERAGKV